MNPFTLLELAESATDEQIKAAYLNKVRQYPPEHYPQQFQQIQAAYQQIKDSSARIQYQLLTPPQFDSQQLINYCLDNPDSRRPGIEQMLKLLADS